MTEASGSNVFGPADSANELRLLNAAILRTMRQPLVVLDGGLVVESANCAFCDLFKIDPDEAQGRKIYELGNGQWNIPDLRALLEDILPDSANVTDFKVEHEFPVLGRRIMMLNAHRMARDGRSDQILLAIEDITDRELARKELEGQKVYVEKIVDSSHDALLVLDFNLKVKTANETFYKVFQVEPSETVGRPVYELGNGQWNIPALHSLLQNVLPDNNAFDDFGIVHDFPKIGRRLMQINARRVDHLQLILLAIDDQTGVEESAALFRSMADNLPHIVWLHDEEGRQQFVNQTFCDYFGVTREEMRDQQWQVLMHPADADAYMTEFGACVRERRPFHAEVRVERGDGEWRWLESWATPRFDDAGHYLGQVGTSADITQRKSEERLRQLLLEELDHRVKNTFALIQAIANQSLRGDRPITELRAAFIGRLRALASANELLTRENWEKARLSQLVSNVLTSGGTLEGRFAAEGPEVVLQPRQATSMALALHELCTNAVKYGALSGERGRVSVRWALREGVPQHLTLVWSEHDGPAVTPPSTRGFGTVLLEQALASDLGARISNEFRPEGLRCTIAADLS
jgi:two-component system, chemotaxis family, CheB/CheR fusion protein